MVANTIASASGLTVEERQSVHNLAVQMAPMILDPALLGPDVIDTTGEAESIHIEPCEETDSESSD